MGFLSFVGKAVGTVVVGGVGCAATMLQACCEATGKDEGAELLNSAKSACFGCVKEMWDDGTSTNEDCDEPNETFEKRFDDFSKNKAEEIKKEMDKRNNN